jgi:hypothetical protein
MSVVDDTMIAGMSAGRPRYHAAAMWNRHTWTSIFLAFFLVALFPSCFYGALQRAQVVTNNTEEEHREHQEKAGERTKLAANARPPTPLLRRHAPAYAAIEPVPPLALETRYIPHPSRFSVRRLI